MDTKRRVRPAFLIAMSLAAALAVPSSGVAGGGEEGSVALCHIPPGNPDARHTIEVGAPALDVHLDHGDWIGACGPSPSRKRGRGRGPGWERARDERERERERARDERKRARDEREREKSREARERERTRETRKRDESWREGWRDVLDRELGRLREKRDAEIERVLAEAGGDGTPEEIESEKTGILNRYLEQVRKLQEDYLDRPAR